MTEWIKIILTSSLTILGGIIVYVAGQIISKFFIEPIHKQAEIIGDISDALVYYAREYSSPGLLPRKKLDEAHERFRQLASLLKAKTYMIKWYRLFTLLGLVPDLLFIEAIARELIGLSNSVYGDSDDGVRNARSANRIRELLGIPLED
jgi:hypothetical protein